MGIQGLLPLLKSIQDNVHISAFSGKTLAVDGYVWLHRGVFTCPMQLVNKEPTSKYVDYFMHRIRMLRHHGVEPYVVFDGGPLPAKKGTESERAKKRAENLARAKALENQGQVTQARDLYTKCIDVSPEMAAQVIKALRHEKVAYVVAPYEADAQLAFLEKEGFVDGIITEDSDLLVFGCKNVIFKLDSDGNCVNIKRERFGAVTEAPMVGWSDKEFRHMAILSGCDYLHSINGLGLKTAHKLLRKYKTVEKVLQYIRLESNMKIPAGYIEQFRIAELPFLHQRVYDPATQAIVHLNPVDNDWDNTKDFHVGLEIEDDVGRGIAEGSIHPATFDQMPDINPHYDPQKRSKGPLRDKNTASVIQGKGTIQSFFTVKPKARQSLPGSFKFGANVGKASGSRTLSAQMDTDREKKLEQIQATQHRESLPKAPVVGTTSRFFPPKRKREDDATPTTPRSSQRIRPTPPSAEKENVAPDLVEQDECYRSPSGSSVIEVSSPVERLHLGDGQLSSPPSAGAARSKAAPDVNFTTPSKPSRRPAVLVYATPPNSESVGVDLRGLFHPPSPSDDGCEAGDASFESTPPLTPEDPATEWDDKVDFQVDVDADMQDVSRNVANDDDDEEDIISTLSTQKVMLGWRNQWSFTGQVKREQAGVALLVQEDTFSSTTPLGLRFTQSPHSVSNTKFRRRKPLIAQNAKASPVMISGKGKRQSPAIEQTSRSSPEPIESFDEPVSSSSLTSKLRSFRYLR